MAETEGEMIHRAHAAAAAEARPRATWRELLAAVRASRPEVVLPPPPREIFGPKFDHQAWLRGRRELIERRQRAERRATIAASVAIVRANATLNAIADGSFDG